MDVLASSIGHFADEHQTWMGSTSNDCICIGAGISCFNGNLDYIPYIILKETDATLFYANDPSGTCIFYAFSLNPNSTLGEWCHITPDQYKLIFTQQNQDAIRTLEGTKKTDAVFNQFIAAVKSCLKQIPLSDFISSLQSSKQLNR